jgi:hypothetical protein
MASDIHLNGFNVKERQEGRGRTKSSNGIKEGGEGTILLI